MSVLASAILTLTRAKLNDTGAAIYTDTVLLPLLDASYQEMEATFEANDIPVQSEISAALTIPAGTVALNASSTPPLPTDFLFPIRLFERDSGSMDNTDWILMSETRWEPNISQQPHLIWWTWREEEIKFVGSTEIREVRIHYKKALETLDGASDPAIPTRAKLFLAARTAMQAALYIGENESRAAALQQEAELEMSKLMGRMVKRQQGLPVRRLPYRVRGWRGYGNY